MMTTSEAAKNASPEDRAHNPRVILEHYRQLAHPDIRKAHARMITELTPEEQIELLALMIFFASNEVRKMGSFISQLSDSMIAVVNTDGNAPPDSGTPPQPN